MQQFFFRISANFLLAVNLILLSCTPKATLLVQDLYSDSSFTGRDLSGAEIVMAPVLMGGEGVSPDHYDQSEVIEKLKRSRSDLSFIGADLFEKTISDSLGQEAVEEFYRSIFESDILDLMDQQRVWSIMPGQFLFVTRVLGGANVRSMEGEEVTRVKMEGELWRSAGPVEVLWRRAVTIISTDKGETDSKLITLGIMTLCDSLPVAVRGYGYEEW